VDKPALLALVGPTASGKTGASIPVALAIGAEIVSVDSMLVYRGMDAGTAKPGAGDRLAVPHHLVDVADPAEPFTVAEFQRLAREAVTGIRDRGAVPLLVGGGGLYYRAVVDGLEFPGTSPDVRALLEAEARVLSPDGLHGRLAGFDPVAAARIEPANLRRTVRALEVAAISGRPFSSYTAAWDEYPPGAVRAAGIDIPRPVLYRRIELRVEAMMPGLVEEARALAEHGFGGFLTSSQAIGYAESVAFLEGAISLDEAAARTGRRTKALARRQLSWLRRDPRIEWFAAGEDGGGVLVEELTAFFQGSTNWRRAG
jgi:tRNA dimethylallyltransferase